MSYLLSLADELMTKPIAQIEAMYNEAWRRHHNEIEPEKYARVMKLLEHVIDLRFYEITGKDGSWELKPIFR